MKLHWWLEFFICLISIHYVYSCGKSKKKSKAKPSSDKPKQASAVKTMLGDNVQLNPYDSNGYDSKQGKAESAEDMKCDFSSPCCWKNSVPPYDTMQWVKATGDPDANKFQANFVTSSAPTGNYLISFSDTATGQKDKAELQSCVIECANGDGISVSLKHWASKGVKLQVCQVAENDLSSYVACQDLPENGPGPDTVSLPPGQNIYLVIVASNFVANGGNMAIIQDIQVAYQGCSSETPEPPPPPSAETTTPAATPVATPDPNECKKLVCDFENGMCNYGLGSEPSSAKGETVPFIQAGPDRYKNPATGVDKAPDGTHYAATYLLKNQNAKMEVESNFEESRLIKFQEYKATDGILFKACCDSIDNCPYSSGTTVEKNDFRQWYQGSLTCNKETKKLIFYAENQGMNEGGIGIDNIQVFDESGSNRIC